MLVLWGSVAYNFCIKTKKVFIAALLCVWGVCTTDSNQQSLFLCSTTCNVLPTKAPFSYIRFLLLWKINHKERWAPAFTLTDFLSFKDFSSIPMHLNCNNLLFHCCPFSSLEHKAIWCSSVFFFLESEFNHEEEMRRPTRWQVLRVKIQGRAVTGGERNRKAWGSSTGTTSMSEQHGSLTGNCCDRTW